MTKTKDLKKQGLDEREVKDRIGCGNRTDCWVGARKWRVEIYAQSISVETSAQQEFLAEFHIIAQQNKFVWLRCS